MASSPNRNLPEAVPEDSILLERLKVSVTLKQCCDNLFFTLVTLLIVADLVTDVWVIVMYGLRQETTFMGVQASLLILSGLISAVAYSTQIRSESEHQVANIYLYLCLNFPFQLGVIYQRCIHGLDKCHHCCPRQIAGHTHAHGPRGKPNNVDWKFAKLKLIQSMFQCTPQLMGNVLHMLMYRDVGLAQIVSAVCSFTSLIFGVVLHEKSRKEQVHGSLMGFGKVLCIFVYKTLVISTRILALVHFIYYFGGWVTVVLFPHIGIMFSFFLYLYRQIWKVQYHIIIQHSLYSVLAYFPIHSEYRPEGEIVLFYILYMVENIVMVALPFKATPTGTIHRMFAPTSRYYFVTMLVILVGATVGLVVMCIYYFGIHKSRHSIRDTHLGWLACLCEWRKHEHDGLGIPPSPTNEGNHTRSPSLRDMNHVQLDNGTRSTDTICHTTVSTTLSTYHIQTEDFESTHQLTEQDAELPVNASLLTDRCVQFVTSTPNPESGSQRERLLIQGDENEVTANRPSVLEGEDEEFEPDTDDRTHIIV